MERHKEDVGTQADLRPPSSLDLVHQFKISELPASSQPRQIFNFLEQELTRYQSVRPDTNQRTLSTPMIQSVQLNFSQTSGRLRDIMFEMSEKRPYREPPAIQGMRERLSTGSLGGRVEHTISVKKNVNHPDF
jgi:hypothetical protein